MAMASGTREHTSHILSITSGHNGSGIEPVEEVKRQ